VSFKLDVKMKIALVGKNGAGKTTFIKLLCRLYEPTSALDPISEYEIYSKFDYLAKNKTSIFISHRMSSCRFCDEIIVLEGGQIVQSGDHDTLIKDEANLYASLYQAQAKHYIRETD
jgi:ABC-type multidrug transport system fused ATPase/permease subunit